MSASFLNRGQYFWDIDDILEEAQINPVSFGRYTACFEVETKWISDAVTEVKIKMKLDYPKNPMLLANDKRTVTAIIKLNNESDQDAPKNGWKMKEFENYVVVLKRSIWDIERAKNETFVMDWSVGKMAGHFQQQIEFNKEERDSKAELLKLILLKGDIKMFYNIDNSNTNNKPKTEKQPTTKRRKGNNDEIFGIDEECKEKSNYFKMSSLLLQNESAYFTNYLSQQNTFKDCGYIDFFGDAKDLRHFIQFIVCGIINKETKPMKMIKIAGVYGVRRLQMALVRNIIDDINYDKYVDTMNTFIRNDIMEDVYGELINYGVVHYKRLKKRGDWSQLDKTIRSTLKLVKRNKRK